MAAPPISKSAAQAALDAHTKYGSIEGAARALWITHPKLGITFTAPVLVERNQHKKGGAWVAWK